MEILLKENVVFDSIQNETELMEKVIDFISRSKTSKILFKGNPSNVNYKLMKKIIPSMNTETCTDKPNIYKYISVPHDSSLRDIYSDFVNKIGCNYCLIYKR